MSWWGLVLGAVGGLSALAALQEVGARRALRRRYVAKIGLDLPGLVALLPPALQTRQFTSYVLAPPRAGRISVGLVYPPDASVPRVGNPPNVGLDFDAETGALMDVHPDGIGLGIK